MVGINELRMYIVFVEAVCKSGIVPEMVEVENGRYSLDSLTHNCNSLEIELQIYLYNRVLGGGFQFSRAGIELYEKAKQIDELLDSLYYIDATPDSQALPTQELLPFDATSHTEEAVSSTYA